MANSVKGGCAIDGSSKAIDGSPRQRQLQRPKPRFYSKEQQHSDQQDRAGFPGQLHCHPADTCGAGQSLPKRSNEKIFPHECVLLKKTTSKRTHRWASMREAARTSPGGGERALGRAAFFTQQSPAQTGKREREDALPPCAVATCRCTCRRNTKLCVPRRTERAWLT